MTDVKIWQENIIIPTYGIGKPDRNPMFFEKRVYQGSSGVVYPHPVVEKILDEKEDKSYNAVFLENKYIKIMVLPELGGRIHMAYDKIKERHFIYYNQVIKPALVGLTGPWISGGIEFNWPQHHRPSTFNPIDFKMEENDDGSKTIWVNEIEQMFHTKGLAGFTLYPDKAYIEIKAQLLNTTSLPQTFLWWANPAVKVNDHYQSVFPPDVHAVFDHGKRDVSSFPIATGKYYKVDYAPGTDISMYKNIPVPTSYMAINSQYDFVGGYEHDSRAGMLHVADHHVSPGKKQWTWGHSDFGLAWDRNLTDEDGPYIELMAGVFTDNQPDFTWIMPNEEKTFTQYFLPYRELGVIQNATKDLLLSFVKGDDQICIKLAVTAKQENIRVNIIHENVSIFSEEISLSPEEIFSKQVPVDNSINEDRLLVTVTAAAGRVLMKYEPAINKRSELPESAKPALRPEEIDNHEQLFLTGQHLEQYRHATYSPVEYYEKVLTLDPEDIRCNNALGLWWLRHGQFEKSIDYFKRAIQTISIRNPNPYDSEPYYHLGVAFNFLGNYDAAYDAFNKAAWDNRWRDSAYFSVAQIDIRSGDFEEAITHIDQSLKKNSANSKAYVVKAMALRKMFKKNEAIEVCLHALKLDPFNLGALFEIVTASENDLKDEAQKTLLQLARGQRENFMAYALDYAAAGLYTDAISFLVLAGGKALESPLYRYYIGYFMHHTDAKEAAISPNHATGPEDLYLCFPNRLEEIAILTFAIKENPDDAKAAYLLGNLFYDKRQYDDAINYWERSAEKDDSFPTVLRNLGIGYFNKWNLKKKALEYFEKAYSLDPTDARVFMELDQLYKRLNYKPKTRLVFMDENYQTVLQRDDVYLEYICLLNFLGRYQEALDLLLERKFHPWEGGEGRVSGQYINSLVQLAKENIETGDFENAILQLEQAQTYPHNLGEGKLYGTRENDIFYWLGCACKGMNNTVLAEEYFTRASEGDAEPSAAIFYNDQQPDKIFYQGLALLRLGNTKDAHDVFHKLIHYGKGHMDDEISMDYFAVSLPDLLVFEDDLKARNTIHCLFMMGLGYLGLENYNEARSAFETVLESNADHAKAQTHLLLLDQMMEVQRN